MNTRINTDKLRRKPKIPSKSWENLTSYVFHFFFLFSLSLFIHVHPWLQKATEPLTARLRCGFCSEKT